jgi:hypothetical protein
MRKTNKYPLLTARLVDGFVWGFGLMTGLIAAKVLWKLTGF